VTDSTPEKRRRLRDVFVTIHTDLPREGPGDGASTRRAFRLLTEMPPSGRILDVGCGPGAQTVELAQVTRSSIVALDIHRPYLHELRARTADAGVSKRVHLMHASMLDVPVMSEGIDAIWAEGSIYIIGFEKGLRDWRRLLRPGGYVAATHLSWLASHVPDEPRTFWARYYPSMTTVKENANIAHACGFELIEQFTLPESAWWDDYYGPMEKRLARLREEHRGDEDALSVIETSQDQIDLYRRFAAYYGYVFYVLRKRSDNRFTGPSRPTAS
jgi:ubiquinone/menaquinone biosynthesis C-methylase UbiE